MTFGAWLYPPVVMHLVPARTAIFCHISCVIMMSQRCRERRSCADVFGLDVAGGVFHSDLPLLGADDPVYQGDHAGGCLHWDQVLLDSAVVENTGRKGRHSFSVFFSLSLSLSHHLSLSVPLSLFLTISLSHTLPVFLCLSFILSFIHLSLTLTIAHL